MSFKSSELGKTYLEEIVERDFSLRTDIRDSGGESPLRRSNCVSDRSSKCSESAGQRSLEDRSVGRLERGNGIEEGLKGVKS